VPLPMVTRETFALAQREADRVECNKCAACCVLPSGKDCRNLIRRTDGTGFCRIYNKAGRIGSPIGEGCVCNNILGVPKLFKGCPYNEIKVKYGLAPPGANSDD